MGKTREGDVPDAAFFWAVYAGGMDTVQPKREGKNAEQVRPDGVTRRAWLAAGLFVAGASNMSLAHAQAKPERPKLTLAVGGKSSLYYLPLTIAEQLGYFRSEGLDLDIIDLSGPQRATQALLVGAADIASCAYVHTIGHQARNHRLQAFVMQGRAPQAAFGVSTRSLPFYQSVADLRGRRIGISGGDSPAGLLPSLVLTRAGLKPSDVSFVDVSGTQSALAALRSGQIDAMSHTDPVMTMLEHKGDVKIISDTRTLKGTLDVYGGPMPAACLQASADFIQRYPNTCQALANGVVHALKWLQTAGPGDIVKTVPESYLLGDRALYLASFIKVRESISLDGLMPGGGPETALRALASQDPGVREARIDLGKTFVNTFAQRAKERFKA